MSLYIPAQQLKPHYTVYGHFYSVRLDNDTVIYCRSVLEIIRRENLPEKVDSISELQPDAVFIMMNPGSSQPLQFTDHTITQSDISSLETHLVLTKPDTTQYQLMRVMTVKGWKHVRVLNLSDLRDPKSVMFIKHFQDIENTTGYTAHSVFCDLRREELKKRLSRGSDAPIICAWGLNDGLNPLIDRCTQAISGEKSITGLLKEGAHNKYLHPLPMPHPRKIEWLEKIVALLGQ